MLFRFRERLGSAISAESLGFFRLVFGTAMVLATGRMLLHFGGATWHAGLFPDRPDFWTFRYPGLEWIRPIGQPWFSILTLVMAFAAICVAAGFQHRVASAVLFSIWSYFHLLERSYHTHVDWLLAVIALLMIFLPADKAMGINVAQGAPSPKAGADLGEAGPLIPFWPVFLLRGQLFIVFFFAGLQGLDWLGEELGGRAPWLPRLGIVTLGILFPLLLLTRRTRWLGILGITLLHAFERTGWVGDLERFPLLAAGLLTIFLEPDWPSRLRKMILTRRVSWPDSGGKPPSTLAATPSGWTNAAVAILIVVWLGLQVVLPLRHWLIAGDVNWTREGEFFSWRLRSVRRETLSYRIMVTDESLLKADAGARFVDWERLGDAQRVFRDHDPTRINWSALPPLVALYQSNWGERLVMNPYFGGRKERMTEEEARRWTGSYWTETFGREPEAVERTLTPDQAFDQIRDLFVEKLLPPFVAARLKTARPLARRVADSSISLEERHHERVELAGLLYGFANLPLVGPDVRAILARVTPFAFDGGPGGPTGFLAITDSALYKKKSPAQNHHALDGERWRGETITGGLVVDAVIDAWTPEDWLLLPPVVVVEGDSASLGLVWNPFQDLMPYQIRHLLTSPIASGDYAAHVAQVWSTRFGARPKVTIQNRVRIAGGPARATIDPEANLGEVEALPFRHREWVIPDPSPADPK